MGRTLLPFRPALEREIQSWKTFKNALSPDNRLIFDELMQYARKHADAGSLAGRTLISEVIFMSIAIEQQKQLTQLQTRFAELAKKIQPNQGHDILAKNRF